MLKKVRTLLTTTVVGGLVLFLLKFGIEWYAEKQLDCLFGYCVPPVQTVRVSRDPAAPTGDAVIDAYKRGVDDGRKQAEVPLNGAKMPEQRQRNRSRTEHTKRLSVPRSSWATRYSACMVQGRLDCGKIQ